MRGPEINRDPVLHGQVVSEWRWHPLFGNYRITILRRGRGPQKGGAK